VRLELTLAGRFIIGSFWRIGRFLFCAPSCAQWIRNDDGLRVVWFEHLLGVRPRHGLGDAGLRHAAVGVRGCDVIPGNGILMIRSFCEHRALPEALKRTAIVERSWILVRCSSQQPARDASRGAADSVVRLQRTHRIHRDRLIADNGGLVYASYFEVARRYLLNPHDSPRTPPNGCRARAI